MLAKIKPPEMIAPIMMPTFALEPRLRSLLSADRFVVEEKPVILLTVTVFAAEVVEEKDQGKDAELDFKNAELEASTALLGIDENDANEGESLFSWFSGVAWKVSAPGLSQCMSVDGVEQQAHSSEV